MSAKGNLKGHLREYGYSDLSGLTVIAKQCRTKNIDFYTEITGKEKPALFFQEKDSEWLVTMKLSDFIEMYREWEMARNVPFYGTGEIENGKHDLTG